VEDTLDVETAQERIQTVLEALTGGVATGWATVLEVVLPSGERELKLVLSDDVRTWHIKGWFTDVLDDLRNVT
jgi:hypothetical protein